MEHPSVARESLKAIHAGGDRSCRWHGAARLGDAFAAAVLGKTLHLTDPATEIAVSAAAQRRHVALHRRTICHGDIFTGGRAVFGWIVGIVFFLLLFSAANTAIVAMIGLLYMMSRDREMPRQFRGSIATAFRCGRWSSPLVCRRRVLFAELHLTGRPVCDRRSRCDHGEPRFLHIQSDGRFHLVRSRPLWHHVCDSGFRRVARSLTQSSMRFNSCSRF